ncbi:MAG: preprotein translocase subunit SecE, partial [Sphaerimonospora mesophila]
MAKQDSDHKGQTVVRRVKASDSKAASSTKSNDKPVVRKVSAKKADTASAKTTAKKPTKASSKEPVFILFRPFVAFVRYFRDSWRELRQVRWPNRRATWALTL